MSFAFQKGKFYLMPVVFGPSSTPRLDINGRKCYITNPYGTQYNHHRVVYESNPLQLERILPEGFTLNGPYVIVSFSAIRNVAFMAGRGYEIASVEVPIKYQGKVDKVVGLFEPVLWESHGDNCIIGREQTGFNKIFGDFETPVEENGVIRASVSTWGFKFMDMKIDLNDKPENYDELVSIVQNKENEGRLHWKYIPRTGEPWTETDADYITFSPYKWDPPADFDPSKIKPPTWEFGRGEVNWYRPTWEQTPTQSQVIQYLADLEIRRFVGAFRNVVYNANDLRNQRILK